MGSPSLLRTPVCALAFALSSCATNGPVASTHEGAQIDRSEVEHRAMLSNPNSRGYVRIPALDQYLSGLLLRVTASVDPAAVSAAQVRVYISGTGGAGADTFSDGAIYIRWGSFSKLNSEDEMAALLAHETSHVLLGHFGKSTVTSWIKPLSTIGMVASMANPVALVATMFGGQAADKALVAAWSRQQEIDADSNALALMLKAGYEPNAFYELLDTLNAEPVVEPTKFADNAKHIGKHGYVDEYSLSLGDIHFGSAERAQPDFAERKANIRKLLETAERGNAATDTAADPFIQARSAPEVRAALRGLEAMTNSVAAAIDHNAAAAQRERQVALSSPVADSVVVQMAILNFQPNALPPGSLTQRLDTLANRRDAPIILSITELEVANLVGAWAVATRAADRLQERYDFPPDIYPHIQKAYVKRVQQLSASLPHGGGTNIPVSAPGRESDFKEYNRLLRAQLSVILRCTATGDLNIMSACSRAAQ